MKKWNLDIDIIDSIYLHLDSIFSCFSEKFGLRQNYSFKENWILHVLGVAEFQKKVRVSTEKFFKSMKKMLKFNTFKNNYISRQRSNFEKPLLQVLYHNPF